MPFFFIHFLLVDSLIPDVPYMGTGQKMQVFQYDVFYITL